MNQRIAAQVPLVATVDLDAIVRNARFLTSLTPRQTGMMIVKSNGYGHGMEPVARALRASGFTWFGVSHLDEALRLRHLFNEHDDLASRESTASALSASLKTVIDPAGNSATVRPPRILTWLSSYDQDMQVALENDLDVSASSIHQLQMICEAARQTGRQARVHLKVDVGMSRGGARPADFPELAAAVRAAELKGEIQVEALWGHLNCADDPDGPGAAVTNREIQVFEQASDVARQAGLAPKLRHLSATAGTLWHPRTHYDLVRPGIGLYGYSPNPATRPEDTRQLQPAMTLSCDLIQVKYLDAGDGVSYGATYVADRPRWVGLLPGGYGDGIPRQASNRAPLNINGHASRILGRVCMDQTIIDLGEGAEPWGRPGDAVTLFGPAELDGQPTGFFTAEDWAEAADTISYTITTGLPPHLKRVYVGQIARELGLAEASNA